MNKEEIIKYIETKINSNINNTEEILKDFKKDFPNEIRNNFFHAIKEFRNEKKFVELNGNWFDVKNLEKKIGFVHWNANQLCWIENKDSTNSFGLCFSTKEKDILVSNKKDATIGSEVEYFEFIKDDKKYAYIYNTFYHKPVNFMFLKRDKSFYCINNNLYINDYFFEENNFLDDDVLIYQYKDNKFVFDKKITNINDIGSEGIIAEYLGEIKNAFEINNQELEKIIEKSKINILNNIDLSTLDFMTIDSPTTTDIDDAIYFEKNENGYKLYVAISDVSSFVQKNDNIDNFAKEAATTYYLNNNKKNMINDNLSEDICSLNIGDKKSAFVCIIDYTLNGEINSFDFCQSNIVVKNKIPYEDVNTIVSEQSTKNTKNSFYYNNEKIENLINLNEEKQIKLSQYLFDFFNFSNLINNKVENEKNYFFTPSPDYKLGSDGKIESLFIRDEKEINPSQKIVESCMLAANICAANHLLKSFPYLGMYRNQESVSDEEAPKSAFYQNQNIGHHSLQEYTYTHFTSPIRRYCDLIIHRLIKDSLNEKSSYSEKELELISENINNKNYLSKQLELKQKDLLYRQYLQKIVKNNELKTKFTFVSFNKNGVLIRNKQLIDVFIPFFKLNRQIQDVVSQYDETIGSAKYKALELLNSKFQLKCFIDRYNFVQDKIDFDLKIYNKEHNIDEQNIIQEELNKLFQTNKIKI